MGSSVQFVRPLPAGGAQVPATALPGPIAVLCDYLRSGRRPPEFVVRCAVAEAELIGRRDLAMDLVQTFGPKALPPPAQGGATQEQAQPQAAPQATQAAPMQFVMPDAADGAAPNMDAGAQQGTGIQAQPPAQPRTLSSPIPGVPDDAWSDFAARLERESPSYDSQRHVGRYRQNKARLAELGFDPATIVNAPDAQDAALAADMADACKHVIASGLGNAVVGKPIAIPDAPDTLPITLSGVLGVASVAGLEGCVEWLRSKHDRKKFPHTTAAFLRTNGAF